MRSGKTISRMFPQWFIMLTNVNIDEFDWKNSIHLPHFNETTNIVAGYYYDKDIEEMFQCPRRNLKTSKS